MDRKFIEKAIGVTKAIGEIDNDICGITAKSVHLRASRFFDIVGGNADLLTVRRLSDNLARLSTVIDGVEFLALFNK